MESEVLEICASPLSDDDTFTTRPETIYLTQEQRAPALERKQSAREVSRRPSESPPQHRLDSLRPPPTFQPLEQNNQRYETRHTLLPQPISEVEILPINKDLCWRCGHAGHRRQNCQNKSRLFCSRCGKVGTLSRQCPCPTVPAKRRNTSGPGDPRHHSGVSFSYIRRRTQPCSTCGCPYQH